MIENELISDYIDHIDGSKDGVMGFSINSFYKLLLELENLEEKI